MADVLQPPRTTTWAGGLLVAGALVQLAGVLIVQVPLDHGAVLPLHGDVPAAVAAALRLVACTVLAVGLRGERGAVGGSTMGAVALIVFGGRDALFLLEGLLPAAAGLPVNAVVTSAVLVAAFVAAAAVLRAGVLHGVAGVLHGVAHVLLVPVAAIELLMTAALWVPELAAAPAGLVVLGFESLWVLQGSLLLVLGAALLLHGREAALRRRLRAVHDAR